MEKAPAKKGPSELVQDALKAAASERRLKAGKRKKAVWKRVPSKVARLFEKKGKTWNDVSDDVLIDGFLRLAFTGDTQARLRALEHLLRMKYPDPEPRTQKSEEQDGGPSPEDVLEEIFAKRRRA